MSTLELNLAAAFSAYPFGRYPAQGDFSGERFRDELLIPALERGDRVVVDLSDARGLAPSFLEEAFGGLVRKGWTVEKLREQLQILSRTDTSLEPECWGYIDEAADVLRDTATSH